MVHIMCPTCNAIIEIYRQIMCPECLTNLHNMRDLLDNIEERINYNSSIIYRNY